MSKKLHLFFYADILKMIVPRILPFCLINWLTQKITSKNIHRDLALVHRVANERLIIQKLFRENAEPLAESNALDIVISFSQRFVSKKGHLINPKKFRLVGKTIHRKLDGQVPTATVETKSKLQLLAKLRNIIGSDAATTPVNALKHFT